MFLFLLSPPPPPPPHLPWEPGGGGKGGDFASPLVSERLSTEESSVDRRLSLLTRGMADLVR